MVGVIVAAWAKLTGFALTAAMVSAVIAYLVWRRRWRWSWTIGVAFAFLVAAAPFVVLLMQYGSPAPDTPAQLAMLKDGARVLGLDELPRKSFLAYLGYFIVAFVAEWMPTLTPRGIFDYAVLVIPVTALYLCFGGTAVVAAAFVVAARNAALDLLSSPRAQGRTRADLRAACPATAMRITSRPDG